MVWADGTGSVPIQKVTDNQKHRTEYGLTLFCLIVVLFLASCGNGDDGSEADPTPVSSPTSTDASRATEEEFLSCYVELNSARQEAPSASPTPETIEIQVLELPNRVVPHNVVLHKNRAYELVITAGDDWHLLTSEVLPEDVLLPPGSQHTVLVRPERLGVFQVLDNRHIRESEVLSTFTVIPEGASELSGHPLCVEFQISSPSPDAILSAPLVVQGTVGAVPLQHSPWPLFVVRVEAWSNGELVGATGREKFIRRGPYSEFFLPVPALPSGSHSLILRAYLQTGLVAATSILSLSVLGEASRGDLIPGYRGSIDAPTTDSLHDLPVTVQGWIAIPSRRNGTGVGTVEIWSGPRQTGTFLTEAIYGTYRPDVAEALGEPRFASSGFFAQLSSLHAGAVDLHVYVRDSESGDYVSPRLLESELTRSISLAEGKVTDAAWPVALAAAPDGRLFYAELFTGNIRTWQNGQLHSTPFATLENVSNHLESGFLGLALHPNFPEDPFVYAMYVVEDTETGLPSGQRFVRFRDVDNVGQDYTVILDNLPATTESFHNGGRIAFGPDSKLYISIGDTDVPEFAQDPTKLEGSILRYNSDGSIPDDNPIPGSPVYATGLRNVFGLAFHPETGDLYATDNGPGGFDEVNKIEAGKNYGWPGHMGAAKVEGYTDPIAVYGNWPERPIGPTGVTFAAEHPNLLLFCAYHDFFLRAVHLVGPDHDSAEDTTVLSTNCALDVTYSTDGWLYYSTISAIYRARLDDLLRLHENEMTQ